MNSIQHWRESKCCMSTWNCPARSNHCKRCERLELFFVWLEEFSNSKDKHQDYFSESDFSSVCLDLSNRCRGMINIGTGALWKWSHFSLGGIVLHTGNWLCPELQALGGTALFEESRAFILSLLYSWSYWAKPCAFICVVCVCFSVLLR